MISDIRVKVSDYSSLNTTERRGRLTNSSSSDISASRYSSIVRWNASRSLRLTGTRLGLRSELVNPLQVLKAHTIHDRTNFVDREKLTGLTFIEATKPSAGQYGETLSMSQLPDQVTASSLVCAYCILDVACPRIVELVVWVL
jgi:hypothetical protein